MRVPCVIYYGLIQMIDAVGVSLQEVRDTLSVKISPSNSITLMTWSSSQEHISLSWTDSSIGSEIRISSLFGPHQTTATDAETSLRSWMWTTNWPEPSTSSMPWETKPPEPSHTRLLCLISCENQESQGVALDTMKHILINIYNRLPVCIWCAPCENLVAHHCCSTYILITNK